MNFFKILFYRSSWVLTIFLFFLGSLIFFQMHIINQTEIISHQMVDTTMAEPSIMAENIALTLESITKEKGADLVQILQSNDLLRLSIEGRMRVLKTPGIRYIYLLYPDNDTLRYLVDASSGEDQARPGQRFESYDKQWLESIRTGKPTDVYTNKFETIGVTHIRPIIVDGKVQAILVFDLMMKRIESIDKMTKELKQIINITIGVVCIIILLVIFNTARVYFIRSKLHTDPLTKIYNRNFLDEMQQTYKLTHYHFIMIDIDHFKKINDTFGHDSGDVVLHRVAQIIASHLRKRIDFVIRMGGEEFLVLIRPDTLSPIKTMNVAKRIHEAIGSTVIILPDGEEIKVSVSLGVNMKTDHASSFEDGLKQTDIALYNAKHNGRNRIEQYEDRRLPDQVELMTLLAVKEALDENRLIPYLQPIYRSNNLTLSHYEMLARIRTREGKIITPNCFLPTIHGTLLEHRMTKQMINYAEQILSSSSESMVSINLLVRELNNTTILNILLYDISDDIAAHMCIEILETDTTDDFIMLGENIQQLKSKGYRIAIDDFGTGYSNFINIAQLDVDYLKIDGSLICQLETNIRITTIVEAIQAFSEKLGIKTVAEFVSSDEILHSIQNIGIDYAQGYILYKPEPVKTFFPAILDLS